MASLQFSKSPIKSKIRDMALGELHLLYDKNVCPNCRQWKFLGGPKEGVCQNIRCDGCGLVLNIATIPCMRFGQVIAEPVGYVIPVLAKSQEIKPKRGSWLTRFKNWWL